MAEKNRTGKDIAASLDVRGTFKLAGTKVTATAAEINALAGQGVTAADAAKLHAITATAAELNLLADSAATAIPKVAKVALTAGTDTGGGVLSWVNPEGVDVIIDRIELDISTAATAACTLSAGVTSVSGTTSSANLIDTLDVHTAAGLFDSIVDHGTNGKTRQILPAGKWLTVSTASGASAGLVGQANIFYHQR